jgi:hypothetical protein
VVYEIAAYILCVILNTVLLAVDNALMDHRMMLHRSDPPGCWVPLPPTQDIATGIDALIAQELETLRRAQEQAVAEKKKTSNKWWGGVEQETALLCLASVPS